MWGVRIIAVLAMCLALPSITRAQESAPPAATTQSAPAGSETEPLQPASTRPAGDPLPPFSIQPAAGGQTAPTPDGGGPPSLQRDDALGEPASQSQGADGQETARALDADGGVSTNLAAQQSAGSGAVQLPHDLSPWGMFVAADIVVKAVMIGLFIASIMTWVIGFTKALELLTAGISLRRALGRIVGERSLNDAISELRSRRGVVAAMLDASATEVRVSGSNPNPEGVKERVASRLERIEASVSRSVARGTGILATIGSTAPFVGLFGTVWGIMNSFIGISKAQTTNLAVVAPGIAEALLATAIGLVAAIPAVMIYNQFARWTAGYRLLVADASAHVQRLVSRDLDRGVEPPRIMTAAE